MRTFAAARLLGMAKAFVRVAMACTRLARTIAPWSIPQAKAVLEEQRVRLRTWGLER